MAWDTRALMPSDRKWWQRFGWANHVRGMSPRARAVIHTQSSHIACGILYPGCDVCSVTSNGDEHNEATVPAHPANVSSARVGSTLRSLVAAKRFWFALACVRGRDPREPASATRSSRWRGRRRARRRQGVWWTIPRAVLAGGVAKLAGDGHVVPRSASLQTSGSMEPWCLEDGGARRKGPVHLFYPASWWPHLKPLTKRGGVMLR
jgi:hypothetical protein